MKNILHAPFLIFLSLLFANTHAQVNKGKWLGGLGLQVETNNSHGTDILQDGSSIATGEGKNLFLGLNGEIGFQFSAKGAIGIGLSYANTQSKSFNSQGSLSYKETFPAKKLYIFFQFQRNLSNRFTYNPRIELYYESRNTNDYHYTSGFEPAVGKIRSNYYG